MVKKTELHEGLSHLLWDSFKPVRFIKSTKAAYWDFLGIGNTVVIRLSASAHKKEFYWFQISCVRLFLRISSICKFNELWLF